MSKRINNTNDSIGDSPKKWNWYKSLWKYKYEIAAAVVVTGVVLGFVVATHGFGALAVGVVAANYAPAAIAGLTLGSVGIAGLAGFALNKAGKSSNSKSHWVWSKPIKILIKQGFYSNKGEAVVTTQSSTMNILILKDLLLKIMCSISFFLILALHSVRELTKLHLLTFHMIISTINIILYDAYM